MRYIVFDDMTACNEQEVARLLDQVSAQRREQALRYKHVFGQYCCLKSYTLLMELLGEKSRPEFIYNSYGQPKLAQGPHFSISHCKAGIAVAISEEPIGIDIEVIRNVQADLVEKTMNELEQNTIAQAKDTNTAFTCFWTQKEAYLKMKGTGIISDIKTTLENVSSAVIETIVKSEKGYVVSLAHTTID